MIILKTLDIQGFHPAIHGMRNPKNSWDKSDSVWGCGPDSCPIDGFELGPNDKRLAVQLANAGPVHGKFRRMITVWVDIIAPLYWWKEFDTYKVGTVANSCSTMHKIHAKEFVLDDFSHEHLIGTSEVVLMQVIDMLNCQRNLFLKLKDKSYWWNMIQLLPTSYNQTRTVQLNYEVLANICQYRRGHKLDEWGDFIKWAESLPYAELFTVVPAKLEGGAT